MLRIGNSTRTCLRLWTSIWHGEAAWLLIRKTVAILALAALGGLIVTLERGSYGVNPRLVVFTRVLLLPLVLTMIGLALEKAWSRWLALAGAVAVLPWAIVPDLRATRRGTPDATDHRVGRLAPVAREPAGSEPCSNVMRAGQRWTGAGRAWGSFAGPSSSTSPPPWGSSCSSRCIAMPSSGTWPSPPSCLSGSWSGCCSWDFRRPSPTPRRGQLCPVRAGGDVFRVARSELHGRGLPLRGRLPARRHRRLGLPGRLR